MTVACQAPLNDIDVIGNMSQAVKDNAINTVVERIVKIHGNS